MFEIIFSFIGNLLTMIILLSLLCILLMMISDDIRGSKCIWKLERAVKNYCKRN